MFNRKRTALIAITLVVVASVLILINREGSSIPDGTPPDQARESRAFSPSPPRVSSPGPTGPARHEPAPASASVASSPETPGHVDDIILDEIEKAVVTYSPEALPVFERFLANPDPAIREEARLGLIRLGEAGGAEILRRATARLSDPEEIKQMEETAAYLELPPYTGSLGIKKNKTEGQ